MSGLVGNTFAFFMFNGEEYVTTKVVHQTLCLAKYFDTSRCEQLLVLFS